MSSTPEAAGFPRFTLSDRLEHVVQIVTFVPLAVTGLVQRYSGSRLSQGIIDALGGIEAVRIIHRVFAAILMVAVVYHLGAIGYRRFVLRLPRSMGLGRADLRAAGQALAYNLGRREARPRQGRYTFEEKIEYWSLVWGTVLMVITGFLLWNPVASAKVLPGSFIPAAKAAHGAEAVLALLAVVVWHGYHVHVRNFNTSIFTGYLSMEEMKADHPLELESSPLTAPPTAAELSSRRRTYLPIFGSSALVLFVGIWLFVTFEETAITTIEPLETPVVFAPIPSTSFVPSTTSAGETTTTEAAPTTQAPTTAPPAEAADLTWDLIAVSLDEHCATCHGDSALGGLNLSSYDTALTGGNSGAGIVPGDPAAGTIVAIQEEGGHAGQLDDAQLADLRAWIAAGAPES